MTLTPARPSGTRTTCGCGWSVNLGAGTSCRWTLFGVPGALLAIPAAATIQIALREFVDYRRALNLGARGDARIAADHA